LHIIHLKNLSQKYNIFATNSKKSFFYVSNSCSKISSRVFRKGEVFKNGKQHVMQKQIRVFYIFIIFALEKLSKFQRCMFRHILPMREFRFGFIHFCIIFIRIKTMQNNTKHFE